MNKMDRIFSEMMTRGDKILILYFPVGDPILGDSVEYAQKYFENGCTVLEIGLPFHDPCLDGKTVRDSMARALSAVDLEGAFALIRRIRERCPNQILQVMTYHGNCLQYGYDEFARKCSDAGVDGVLCPDAGLHELQALDIALEKYGIRNLRFAPYFLNDQTIADLKKMKGGYIFQQSVNGGTGEQPTVSPQIGVNVKTLKASGITIPICAGFGISNAAQVKEAIGYGADGVIVGSATINHILAGDGEAFIKSLRDAM